MIYFLMYLAVGAGLTYFLLFVDKDPLSLEARQSFFELAKQTTVGALAAIIAISTLWLPMIIVEMAIQVSGKKDD